MGDILGIAFIALALPLVVIAAVTWGLQYFVALRAPPSQRAAWIVGIAYAATALLMIFAGPADFWWAGPFAALPGALLALWWWRRDFQQRWFDDSLNEAVDVERENDDWRIGLIFVGGVIVIAIIRALFRMAVNGKL